MRNKPLFGMNLLVLCSQTEDFLKSKNVGIDLPTTLTGLLTRHLSFK